jgi:hypothetical protein
MIRSGSSRISAHILADARISVQRGSPSRYNSRFPPRVPKRIMEADQLNAIENQLADLHHRTAELRRYL